MGVEGNNHIGESQKEREIAMSDSNKSKMLPASYVEANGVFGTTEVVSGLFSGDPEKGIRGAIGVGYLIDGVVVKSLGNGFYGQAIGSELKFTPDDGKGYRDFAFNLFGGW